jgi:hypothetical protein
MGRAETDQATDYLRGAAIDIKHALEAKRRWGIRHPESHDRALARLKHWIAVLDGEKPIGPPDDEDRC